MIEDTPLVILLFSDIFAIATGLTLGWLVVSRTNSAVDPDTEIKTNNSTKGDSDGIFPKGN